MFGEAQIPAAILNGGDSSRAFRVRCWSFTHVVWAVKTTLLPRDALQVALWTWADTGAHVLVGECLVDQDRLLAMPTSKEVRGVAVVGTSIIELPSASLQEIPLVNPEKKGKSKYTNSGTSSHARSAVR